MGRADLSGKLVATVLSGAWRRSPPPLELSADQLNEVAPLLLKSGAGALGWWRIRHSDLRELPVALELRDAYRLHSLHSAMHQSEICRVILLLRASDIEPVLVKGWAVARFYPEMGLRPYGDIDLCFRREQFRAAEQLLERPPGKKLTVDLHDGFAKLDDANPDDLLARSILITIGDLEVRTLGLEDQLRILCTHLLRHSVWRPLWLCDIAAALESLPANFDWECFLGRDPVQADWLACAIGLAHQLLGVDVAQMPVAARATSLPSWLVPHVLKNWSRPFPELYPPLAYTRPLATYLRDPRGLIRTLRMRWPDPIEATVRLHGPLDESARLPYQLRNLLSRFGKFFLRLPQDLREE
jgi:hypothetical protein